MNRYDRQIRVKEIGLAGQEKLAQATILIVGVGATGSYAAEILARMGVHKLILIDRDFVELSNLQRQSLFTEADVAMKLPKAYAAKEHLQEINHEIAITAIVDEATMETLSLLKNEVTAVLDCTDNFSTRRMLNDFCLEFEIPWVFTSCAGNFANVMPILPNKSACLTCLIGETPQTNEASCDIIGVNGALIPILAGFQVSLLMRMLIDPSFKYNLYYQLDNWQMTFQKLNVLKRSDCPSCGLNRKKRAINFFDQPTSLCGRDTVQFRLQEGAEADFKEIKRLLNKEQILFTENPFILTFSYQNYQFSIFKNGRVYLHGTSDLLQAKKIYQHFFN
ncbi:ThiF family adenylyltransferase [Listeria sp. PSOL-1]|uniref:ThiF family adenylyltransferase n=1 Tax=Listeria sp. PSOL-1 TaxID=1844999 RepID=UPI0013D6BF37|nr:ThiF family adenylyltransferase [Listeria sp. PSOL-1]